MAGGPMFKLEFNGFWSKVLTAVFAAVFIATLGAVYNTVQQTNYNQHQLDRIERKMNGRLERVPTRTEWSLLLKRLDRIQKRQDQIYDELRDR